MKAPWRNLNLKSKFLLLAALGLIIWLFNISIVYIEIRRVNQSTTSLELVEDLYNMILEIRRYEKNFVLYQGQENLDETVRYFQRVRDVCAALANDPQTVRNKAVLSRLRADLTDYGSVLEGLTADGPTQPPSENTQEKMRAAGKQMVDLSQGLLEQARKRVTETARNSVRWPLISMGLILLLFVVVAGLLSRKVITPLLQLERATEKIGRGDFGPILHSARIESEVDRLILAFNRMVEELEARQEQIIHSRKIASLGTLVSGVAHELNNPINNIILTVDSLVGGRRITEERRAQMLNDILTQAGRAGSIVKNLLDFSRAETSTIQDVDLGRLLKDTVQITGNQISLNQITLLHEIDPDLPRVRGNRQGLQQVFVNLITNAIQAMPGGGLLSVRAAEDKNKRIVVEVQDTGKGIPEEHLPHIFDPFFTTKEVGQGTGLGLSVSYGIIKKHGGRINVESRPGRGCTFTVVLPIGEEMIDG